MGDRNPKGILFAAVLWVVILGILAVAAKVFVLPHFRETLERETGSESRYKHEIALAADSFSGYCILRSPALHSDLRQQGIKLDVRDDNADYQARMKALLEGKVQMAVFTIDSFLSAGSRLGRYPASIVMLLDETSGADAIVSYGGAVANIQDLDDPEARLVLTPDSPSEFLARTVIAHFSLPQLPPQWWVEAKGAEEVYRRFITADRTSKRAYVLWEPYVSKVLETEGAKLLLDSSKLKGYIVDVLVAERNFLAQEPALVRAVVESYFRAAYAYNGKPGGMAALVREDTGAGGSERLSEAMAEKLVRGIEWKNTLENYAAFGLLPKEQAQGSVHLEDIISNITRVLIKTGALAADPLDGKAHTIFHDKILKEMQVARYHPGKKVNVLEGVGLGTTDLERVRPREELRPLTQDQWNVLVPVGRLRFEPIRFARGTARINVQSERSLDELARSLQAWPHYYLRVVGNARAEGDEAANMQLAEHRARAAADHLLSRGIPPSRVRVTAAPPAIRDASAQSVVFELLQMPY